MPSPPFITPGTRSGTGPTTRALAGSFTSTTTAGWYPMIAPTYTQWSAIVISPLSPRGCVSPSGPSHTLQQIGDGMRHGRRIPAPGGPPLPAKQRPGGEIDREAPHPVPPEVYGRKRSRGARDRHTLAPAGQPAVKEPAEECFLGNRRDASSREGKPCARSRRVHGEHPGGRERRDTDGGDAPPPGATPLAAGRPHRDGDPQHAGDNHHSPPGHRRQRARKQRRAPGRQGRDPQHVRTL